MSWPLSKTDADIEEERRLLYVAMTRAKTDSTLLVPLHSGGPGRFGGGDALGHRSRFLPDDILQHFEVSAWRNDQDDDDGANLGGSIKVDVRNRIHQRWFGQQT